MFLAVVGDLEHVNSIKLFTSSLFLALLPLKCFSTLIKPQAYRDKCYSMPKEKCKCSYSCMQMSYIAPGTGFLLKLHKSSVYPVLTTSVLQMSTFV